MEEHGGFMKWMILLLMMCSVATAQVSNDEAQKRLEQKQAAKMQAREKVVTITQGELDDLRAEISVLRSQLAKAQADLKSTKASETKPNPVVTKKTSATTIPMSAASTLKLEKGQHLSDLQAAFGTGRLTVRGDGSKSAEWAVAIDPRSSPNGKSNTRTIRAVFSSDDLLTDFEDQYDFIYRPTPTVRVPNAR